MCRRSARGRRAPGGKVAPTGRDGEEGRPPSAVVPGAPLPPAEVGGEGDAVAVADGGGGGVVEVPGVRAGAGGARGVSAATTAWVAATTFAIDDQVGAPAEVVAAEAAISAAAAMSEGGLCVEVQQKEDDRRKIKR